MMATSSVTPPLAPPLDFSQPLEKQLHHLSVASNTSRLNSHRESYVESADDAAGIFSLYGEDTDGDQRDGWVAREESTTNTPPHERMEQLGEAAGLGTAPSWEGPFSALSNQHRLSAPSDQNHIAVPAPGIKVTPDHSTLHTPEKRQPISSARNSTLTSSARNSTFTSSTSGSPTHPSIARLSPRVTQRGGSADTSFTSATSGSGSQISIAGSCQYPGEEDDAFHVRSTYKRLEVEGGVFEDGFGPGIERTRGGPQMAARRHTVYPATKSGDIGEKERQFLANLDRYGFVNEPLRNRSETRVALIPTAPLLNIPKLPRQSPIPKGETAQPAPPNFGSGSDTGPSARVPESPRLGTGEEERGKRKEAERVDKWMRMMSVKKRDEGGNITEWGWRRDGQGSKLPNRIYKGVPDRWRLAAWWTMAEERTRDKGKGKAKSLEQLTNDYRHLIDQPSPHDVQIDLDVPRTISGHTLFMTRYGSGQRSLFHVLHCFSLLCPDCGYCQGMGPIAATLLCYFDPERAYALLVRLHDTYDMHTIFSPGFPGLLEAFYVQERLMEWLMPDVYRSFQRNTIASSSWGTKWYITLFVNTVPFSQQLRFWDALWMDGRDVMILTSVAILWAFRDLLAAKTATFESILSLLSSYFVAQDEDVLMRWVRKMVNQPGVKVKMDGWRVEWQKLVEEGKDGTALL